MKLSFWKTMTYRWDREELQKWNSIRKTAYLLLPLLLYFVVNDITEVILWVLTEFMIRNAGEGMISFLEQNAFTVRGAVSGIAILVGTASVFPAVKNELSGEEKSDNDKGIPVHMFTSYCFLAAFAVCTAISVNILFYQSGFTANSRTYGQVREAQYGVQFIIGLILYGVISPLAEETVFRGLLYNRMKRCFHFVIALIVSSLLFGIYHGNLVQAAYGTILGLLIAYTYEIYGSFAAPVLFHAVANISVYAMTYSSNRALMDRKIARLTGAITFAAAVLIFIYIKKKAGPVVKQDNSCAKNEGKK